MNSKQLKKALKKRKVLVVEIIISICLLVLMGNPVLIIGAIFYFVFVSMLRAFANKTYCNSGLSTKCKFSFRKFTLFQSIIHEIAHYRVSLLLLGSFISVIFLSPIIASIMIVTLGLFLNIIGELNRIMYRIKKNNNVRNGQIIYFTEEDIKALKIQVILHISGPVNTAYQLKQWLPVFENLYSSNEMLIIVRGTHFLKDCSDSKIPILYIRPGHHKKLRDLVQGICPKYIFYVNNSAYNVHLTVLRQFCHIHLNHGDSDKGPNALGTSKDMDFVFVAGEAAKQRYLNSGWSPEKIIPIGRPQINEQLVSSNNQDLSKNHEICILYAPTFEGAREYDC
jgi:hypothetical protein